MGLYEDINHVPVLIHGTPEVLSFTVDGDEYLVQKPCIAESTLSSLQTVCILGTELRALLANCLVRHDDSSLGKKILDIPKAEAEFVVEPYCVTDDLTRISVAVIEGSVGFHTAILAVMGPS